MIIIQSLVLDLLQYIFNGYSANKCLLFLRSAGSQKCMILVAPAALVLDSFDVTTTFVFSLFSLKYMAIPSTSPGMPGSSDNS